ncbi:MAG: hypothetical protein ACOYNX_07950, partial [Geothrix sp.]
RSAGKGLLLCGAGASWQEPSAGAPGSGLEASFETLEAALLCAEQRILRADPWQQGSASVAPPPPLTARLPLVLEAG